MFEISLLSKLAGLAIVDAINPCALAVMAMVLITLLLRDPANKKNILLGGFAFTLAVFLLYFFYGFVIVQFFSKAIPAIGNISLYVFRGFGALAIILGLLNIRDYLNYRPGAIATEMPLSFRPRVKIMIKSITSPWGAFYIGIFVTLFLLPCTMGPYFIFSGTIFEQNFLDSIILLLIYNLIFVLPMIAVTLMIYFGASTIERVKGWEEKNIKRLHLAEGIILILLGIAMAVGWI